jgi:predicted dehydrogenase
MTWTENRARHATGREGVTPDDTSPLRLGLVGFGRVVREYYLPAFRLLDGIEVRGVADPSAICRTTARELLRGVKTYASAGELLDGQRLDALLVASPPSTHLGIWVEASGQRVPVFMEKPFLVPGQLARLEEILDADARRLFMINFNRRFWPPYRKLGALVRTGVCGPLRRAKLLFHVDVLRWCSVSRHRLTPEEGGVLCDLGSQALDLVHDLIGAKPSHLSVRTRSVRWPADHVDLRLSFADGLEFQCDLAYTSATQESVVIEGTEARLRLRDPNMAIHVEDVVGATLRLTDRMRDVVTLGYRAIRRNQSMARHSIRESLAEFVRSVRTGEPFSPGFDDAVRVARWLDTASRAANAETELAV